MTKKNITILNRVTDGRDLQPGELVNFEGAICEFAGTHDGGKWAVLKLKGGSLMPVDMEEQVVTRTSAKKRQMPAWIKRGVMIWDRRVQERFIINSVGNTRVYLMGSHDVQLSYILLYCCEAPEQPSVASWIKPGITCRYNGFKATILAVDGYMAKIHVDYGFNTVCDLDAYCGELRPDCDEHELGMSCEEIEQRYNDINFRVYRGGARIGKYDKFTSQEKQEMEELSCRRMINSCLIYDTLYDFYNEATGELVRYGVDYEEKLGKELVLQLIEAQKRRFAHAQVGFSGHDGEGVSYNYCLWDVV